MIGGGSLTLQADITVTATVSATFVAWPGSMVAIFHAPMSHSNETDEISEPTWTDRGRIPMTAATAATRAVTPEPAATAGFEDAMHARELAAMRGFVRLVLALVGAVALGAPLLDLDRVQWIALGVGMAVSSGGALWTWPRLRRGVLAPIDTAVLGATSLIGGSAGIYTFGFFSPVPLVTIMGIFFFGLQRRRRSRWRCSSAPARRSRR